MRSDLVVLPSDVIICNEGHLPEANSLRVSVQFAASSTITAADSTAVQKAIAQGVQRSVAIRARAQELAQAGALGQALVARGFAPHVALNVPQRRPAATYFRKLGIADLKFLTRKGREASGGLPLSQQRAPTSNGLLAHGIEASLNLFGVSTR